MYLLAYGRIYSNQGAMTPGATQETVDGMSLEKIEALIDDYGGALVGTSTIDLYMTSRAEMRRWGVKHEEIEIIQWGSEEESLKILRTRTNVGRVRRMIASLEAQRGRIVRR